MRPPKDTIVQGLTFSRGDVEVNVKDILIVESDSPSQALIGKKALIVKSDVEFSHILALSKQLKIPSMFNTGDFSLEGINKVNFVSYNKESWISKI